MPGRRTSGLRLAVAWVIVVLPLAWGVYRSVLNSLPLFRMSAAHAPPEPAKGK